jgi:GNAT superfamily N-acetyltransferase
VGPPASVAASDATSDIRVVPATPDRWADVLTVLGGDGDLGCWCQAPRGRVPGGRTTAPGLRRAALRDQLGEEPPPGILAYVDGEVAGWCGFGPRPLLPRLVRSRTIPAIDDAPVWSILCFKIRVGYRRRGVAKALLGGVVELARHAGAPGVEAYPIDPGGERVDVGFAYVGLTPMFEQAGFRRVLETSARSAGRPRWLMRLDFDRGVTAEL